MAMLYLINFPEFSESKEILKIGRSEVCVGGAQWEKGGNFKKLKISKITRYNVYGL